MSGIKSVGKVNQEKNFSEAKKNKNLKRDKFVELGNGELIKLHFLTKLFFYFLMYGIRKITN